MEDFSLIKPENPLTIPEDDYSWLELSDPLPIIENPLTRPSEHPIDPWVEMITLFMDPKYIHFFVKHILNLELLPFQCVILRTFFQRRMPILVASRGSGKSFILAVYSLIVMLLDPGCKVVVVGAAFRQAKEVFNYMCTIWEKSSVLRDLARRKTDGPKKDIDRVEFRIGDSRFFGLPVGDGCVSADCLITYDHGFRTIASQMPTHDSKLQNIFTGHTRVWGNSSFRYSDEKYCNGVRPTKRVRTKRGFSFEATHNHRMKVLRDRIITWVRADEICIGDRILIDRSYRWHNGNFSCTSDESYALGLMIGDGCWTNPSILRFATGDAELVASLDKGGFGTEWRWAGPKDPYHWRSCGRAEGEAWLDKWGLEVSYAKNKKLPDSIMSASREAMTACLQGLFDTDGGVQAYTGKGGIAIAVSFWNTSETLIDQMHYILLHYGIIATKRCRCRGVEAWNKEFQLHITGQNVLKFANEIGFRLLRKQKVLDEAIAKKSRWIDATDGVPGVANEMSRVAETFAYARIGGNLGNGEVSSRRISRRDCITRNKIKLFLERFGGYGDPFIEKLRELANPDIFYDVVQSVEESECPTYDIHVPEGHEYCASGFFSHNSKIRGIRANYILVDEIASVPEEVLKVVILGFGVVAADPVQKSKIAYRVKSLKQKGEWTQEMEDLRRKHIKGNQIVLSGTAYYQFNHLNTYLEQYRKIIESKGDQEELRAILGGDSEALRGLNWKDYSVLRVPYTELPEDFLDPGILAQAKATLHTGQFLMEYCAVMSKDTNGFYRRSVLEEATTYKWVKSPLGENVKFVARRQGDVGRAYAIGIDPAADTDNAAVVVVEMHTDHRRVVYCWTTNKAKFRQLKKMGHVKENDYYKFLARKIKTLVATFNTERIVMDKHGGGTAIAEALADPGNCEPGEEPIYEIIDPEEPKHEDALDGLHILELVKPTTELNAEANHGMLKDFQDKALMFPALDTVEMERAILIDKTNPRRSEGDDNYEDVVQEIEELKDEITTIVCTPSSKLGLEHFDTPDVKIAGQKKGRLRKDRFSALLYANYYCRSKGKNTPLRIVYQPVGGTRDTIKPTQSVGGGMYTGPGVTKFTDAGGKTWIRHGPVDVVRRNPPR